MAHKVKTLVPVVWPLVILVLLAACSSPSHPPAAAAAHWSDTGEDGPAPRAGVTALCATGTAQPPVDIAEPSSPDPPGSVFNHQPSRINIVNNSHTIQAEATAVPFNR